MPRRIPWLVLAAWLVALPAGHAGPAETDDAKPDRASFGSQRAAANAALAEKERGCRSEFMVAACLDAAREDHQRVLTRLRNEELTLDDAQRKESAARRRQGLLEKAAARDAKRGSAEPTAAHAASQAALPPAWTDADAVVRPRDRPAVAGKANRAAFEEENKAQFEARAKSAQAHREAVEQRNAERAAKGKKANPLPVSAAASAPAGPASTR